MSTSNPQPGPANTANPPTAAPAPPPAPPKPHPPQKREVRIVSHCTLFYWWPVWFAGFIMFLITAFNGELLVTVPSHTTIMKPEEKVDDKGKVKFHYDFVVPAKKENKAPLPEDVDHPGVPRQPHLWISASKNLGVVFVVIILLVIVITNVPFRGLWSALIIGSIFTLSILFLWLDLWEKLLTWLSWLDIRINAAGYLVISVVLFTLWLLVFLLFDRQVYIVFRPGVVLVRLEIGGAETMLETVGLSVEKQRSDFFRHWLLGFFSAGDLIVRPANKPEIHFPNVLLITSRVKRIEDTLQIKEVESAGRPQ